MKSFVRVTGAVVALVWLVPAARAVPPDARLQLAPGSEKFLKTHFRIDSTLVIPEGLVDAEGMPANEVYVSVPPTAHGSGLIMALGLDRIYVWDLCVAKDGEKCPEVTSIESARGECPDLAKKQDDDKVVWSATVKKASCLGALQKALAHAEPSSPLELSMSEQMAADFIRGVAEAIAMDPSCEGLTAGYSGATLVLKGNAKRRAVDHAVLDAYRLTVGHVSYDASAVTLTDLKPATTEPPPDVVPYEGPPDYMGHHFPKPDGGTP